jgi:hypothetical protein
MRIATYDEVDGVATIFQEAFDPETGEIYSQPLQFGTDAGVKRYIEITADAFTWNGNTGLVNNHPYYFAVSAYSYDPDPGAQQPGIGQGRGDRGAQQWPQRARLVHGGSGPPTAASSSTLRAPATAAWCLS